ncbi:ABC-type dipeptide/oligopeptide/nickel transport system ATPase component [Microbacterium sp. SLBN-154]|uniref:ABC transporter ATP-binding protein n=1 Tax=Microbacterium sp. SLBN-154 TaxID=2768458 RepID=UPI0011501DD6|nr:ABC transporter ATP-binding protein [Microbacterium sp. SLBN-154]TQK17586.1 ABC-type dipeptide/oligopeptide/nickel transport system ATPase component [Microbacterium sp. SLBN-154]
MSLLEIQSLSVTLPVADGERQVLFDVDLTLEEGETLALVGESGSGKSMTARSILRLLPPRARVDGSIVFDGRSVLDADPAELRELRRTQIGMIFQDARSSIDPVRTVGDFLTEGLLIGGMSRKDAQARALQSLDAVRISDARARMRAYPHELSGGMLQRVMIASVVQAGHRLILADEATSALDVTTQAEVVGILAELQKTHGLAMLFITHDLDLAASICHRTAVINRGRIVEVQDSDALYSAPTHEYTIQLLASRPNPAGRNTP